MRGQAMRRARTQAWPRSRCRAYCACALRPLVPQQPLSNTIVITPSSGCGLLTAYTAGTGLPAWSSPAPSCGTGAFTLAFNQGNTRPAGDASRRRRWDGGQRPVWRGSPAACPREQGWGTRSPPRRESRSTRSCYDDSQLQNIADGRGWIGFTYWNGGTAPVHPNGTAVDAAASGLAEQLTPYWGIELRCVQSVCSGRARSSSIKSRCTRAEAQGPSITPVTDPSSLWNQTGHWIWNAPGNAWSLPVTGADSSGVCSLGLQVGTSAPIADPSLPPPNNSSWQECQPASWTAAVDTRDYVSGAGPLPVTLQATNAAGLPNAPMSRP